MMGSGLRKKTDEDGATTPKKAPLWLVTFTDAMALMLTFFVLMYAMSVPEEEKWEQLSSAMTEGFSKFKSPQLYAGALQEINIEKLDYKRALNLDYLESLLNDIITKDEGLENIIVIKQNDRLMLSLPVDLMFDRGQTSVSSNGKKALFSIGGPLSRIRNRIEVIGHTDTVPVSESRTGFSSNWELSVVRASQVAALLEDIGYSRNIIIRGMSSARYEELPKNINKKRREDLARRVDIMIMKDDGNQRLLIQ